MADKHRPLLRFRLSLIKTAFEEIEEILKEKSDSLLSTNISLETSTNDHAEHLKRLKSFVVQLPTSKKNNNLLMRISQRLDDLEKFRNNPPKINLSTPSVAHNNISNLFEEKKLRREDDGVKNNNSGFETSSVNFFSPASSISIQKTINPKEPTESTNKESTIPLKNMTLGGDGSINE